ncbi:MULTISPECIES: K+/H+ antiporter subunit F [Paracoccus]|jgi:multicomponent K+:H+ antiporter subunit F|uniref:K+/H+ antiporter subunit F n=2 Tax=Paracoccus TaxID=265 RepID=A0A5C4R3K1_9RHOB|nr:MULTISPECIES: K+/H+ antiporter subunit F [Paracoccus]TYP69239.1 multisubunit potassium/proton antiporter PhaF subunit [Stutzerimonas stutzeri]AZY93404.1 K+/H+ antiporter subunit F [Paracoccus sp. Arc7-R13]KIX18460.1 monovalent cation/H+ antiporter subunit F [Paracoccus sp. 228]KJZ30729.1 monovalent cation/H+ antiporter subunit F [Paracoccus sp. S4493]MBF5077790.1 K+/H+ antiporter subunit F [Paracoccus sp. NBH48]|tara:strand:+ start:143 stop:424 length:282 start_codon:yes stop_codon:yes gene_type:complete
MSGTILTFAIGYAQVVLALAGCLAGLRILRGPRAQDRVLALDTLYIAVMLLFLVTGMRLGSLYLFEAAMVIAVMGFVASIALAKFLFRGEVIE